VIVLQRDNHSLIKRAQNGDEEAKRLLIENNSGLIWSIVRRYLGRGVDCEDLYQLGCIGLLKAVNKFDPSYNVQFSTYAVPMIMGEIKRFLRDDGIIKVSRAVKETAQKAKSAQEILKKELLREPTIGEIADYIGYGEEDVVLALEATQNTESIYKTIHDGDQNPVLLIDKVTVDTGHEEDIINQVALKEALRDFDKRERQIIILRYFKQKTQSEIAKMLGISQVQVSRIEKKVLNLMREKLMDIR